jgi:hypothetical protein
MKVSVYTRQKIHSIKSVFTLQSLSFSTVRHRNEASYVRNYLISIVPVQPIGVFGHFWAAAYLHTGASPNEVFSFNHHM